MNSKGVYIHPRGPKYFENYDKIAWDKQEPKKEERDEEDSSHK